VRLSGTTRRDSFARPRLRLTYWDPKGSVWMQTEDRPGKEAPMKTGQIIARSEARSFYFGGHASFMGRYA
jgi:hypothetical protein